MGVLEHDFPKLGQGEPTLSFAHPLKANATEIMTIGANLFITCFTLFIVDFLLLD